ncbi:VacJ family lipoprotein [Marinihelvus fidelis]|uniref:VacJ family lipoprotein n=1 Tax=Marinihelvus fidelis TaxID=2613842 RepID=A0A5N0T7F8_9GAMM|nr:VacJ family lipoprotein [Marinihelvus fidelis]KAA9130923.1 VacJ family lipoprotein [Marinihelvus fidelis]
MSFSRRGHWLAIALCALLSACAGTQNRHTDPVNDPWEGYNRKMHAFNMGLDRAVLRPVAKGYDTITPDPLQRGIGNFFRNLSYPVTALNQIFQGKFVELGESTDRFIKNTTFGLLGFIDVATMTDVPFHDEDFGQTMATWGWEDSRYFVLPIFGPSTIRDTFGRSVYGTVHPISIYAREQGNYWPAVADVIQFRAQLLPRDEQISSAYDPYVLIRDAWLQNRTYLIYDGEPPEPDYDAYLQDLEE